MRHSNYQLYLQQQALWVDALGVTTLRDAEDYVRDFRQLVRPIIHKPWAIVLDMRRWQASPAEQFPIFRDNTRWCVEHNLHLALILMPENALLAWQFLQSTDVPRPDYFLSQKVENDEQALAILKERGYLAMNAGFNREAKPV